MTNTISRTTNPKILFAMHAASFERGWLVESFSALLTSAGVEARVIENTGFLLTRSVVDEMEVLTIAILPEARRKGCATVLMRDALKHAASEQIQSCFLEVDQHNVAAIRCYENLGFSVISTRKNYYKTPQGNADALVMRIAL